MALKGMQVHPRDVRGVKIQKCESVIMKLKGTSEDVIRRSSCDLSRLRRGGLQGIESISRILKGFRGIQIDLKVYGGFEWFRCI